MCVTYLKSLHRFAEIDAPNLDWEAEKQHSNENNWDDLLKFSDWMLLIMILSALVFYANVIFSTLLQIKSI